MQNTKAIQNRNLRIQKTFKQMQDFNTHYHIQPHYELMLYFPFTDQGPAI